MLFLCFHLLKNPDRAESISGGPFLWRKSINRWYKPKQKDFDYSMEELANLAAANNMEVVGEIRQNIDRENRATYVGKGKVDEIKGLAEMQDARLIIFNDELSPSQIRNLEEALELDVMDRTGLILAIFANRAKTKKLNFKSKLPNYNMNFRVFLDKARIWTNKVEKAALATVVQVKRKSKPTVVPSNIKSAIYKKS